MKSREISRIDRISLDSSKSGSSTPASIISRTRSAEPTFSAVVVSDMFESPTMTCRRRYRAESAWGSSRVLMIGRDRVVAEETPSQTWSERCERQKPGPKFSLGAPGAGTLIFPAPQIS